MLQKYKKLNSYKFLWKHLSKVFLIILKFTKLRLVYNLKKYTSSTDSYDSKDNNFFSIKIVKFENFSKTLAAAATEARE